MNHIEVQRELTNLKLAAVTYMDEDPLTVAARLIVKLRAEKEALQKRLDGVLQVTR